MTLDQVDDIETLRGAAKLLEAEVQKLLKLNAQLTRRLNKLEGKDDPEQLSLQIAELEQQLSNLRHKMFGDSSEKRARSKPSSENTKQSGHGPRAQPALPEQEQVHLLDTADQICRACGNPLNPWNGQFEESEEIDVVERKFVLKKHRRQKYRCNCGQCIETAPGPTKLFEGARYSPDFALHVAVGKYADHLPLERQVRIMKREGLSVDSQTLWDQLNALGRVLQPVHDRLQHYVLSHDVIGADETHWRLMAAKGKRNGGDAKRWQAWAITAPDAVCYRIQDSRSAEAAARLLADYDGTVLVDGYSAYSSLKKRGGKFRLAHCWAHVRRKFLELEGSHPRESEAILGLIGQLYEVEKKHKDRPPDQLLEARRAHSKPIIQQIHSWALSTEALRNSPLRKAVEYMGNMWEGLKVFLDDPHVELDNNRTERSLRGVVLGRKNHFGSRSRRGTEVAALFYSLIESAKLAGIGPQTYLKAATQAALRGAQIPLPHELV